MKRFYTLVFGVLFVGLLALLQPASVTERSEAKRLWMPGPYCVFVPRLPVMDVSKAPCGFIRAETLQPYSASGTFVSIDSIFVSTIGMRYSLPADVKSDVYMVNYNGASIIVVGLAGCLVFVYWLTKRYWAK